MTLLLNSRTNPHLRGNLTRLAQNVICHHLTALPLNACDCNAVHFTIPHVLTKQLSMAGCHCPGDMTMRMRKVLQASFKLTSWRDINMHCVKPYRLLDSCFPTPIKRLYFKTMRRNSLRSDAKCLPRRLKKDTDTKVNHFFIT